MLLEVHMTFVDGVARLFFDCILLCWWRLSGVSIVAGLRR